MIKLKPCPFCGEKAKDVVRIRTNGNIDLFVGCSKCVISKHVEFCGEMYPFEKFTEKFTEKIDEVAKLWNERIPT